MVQPELKMNKTYDFTNDEIERYSRHIILPEVGGEGQKKLIESKVLVVGAGGLGSIILMYLAAAGVGTLGIIDDDKIELSNLQRQIIHKTENLGIFKVDSAEETIKSINPSVKVLKYKKRLIPSNAEEIVSQYDIVADGIYNFQTRFLVNDVCYFFKKTLVTAAILRFEGQISTFNSKNKLSSCYRCLWHSAPSEGAIATCAQAGVFGALAGNIGTLQAIEILKEILQIGNSLNNYLMIFDALSLEMRKVKLKKDPNCMLCGKNPTILSIKNKKDYK